MWSPVVSPCFALLGRLPDAGGAPRPLVLAAVDSAAAAAAADAALTAVSPVSLACLCAWAYCSYDSLSYGTKPTCARYDTSRQCCEYVKACVNW